MNKLSAWMTGRQGTMPEPEAIPLLRDFWKRDYRSDIGELNKQLAMAGYDSAGLDDRVPPIPFTGDPFSIQAGKCIALVSINPKWNDREVSTKYSALSAAVCRLQAGDENGLQEMLQHLRAEFQPGSPTFSGRHFTRLGRHFAREWFGGGEAIDVLRERVLKSDCLPWFSFATIGLDPAKLLACHHPALKLHHRIVESLFRSARPRWIEFNGSRMRDLIQIFTGARLEKTKVPNNRGHVYLGRATRFNNIPVLVHAQANSQSGPQAPEQFRAIASKFREWVGDRAVFEFD